MPPAGEARLLLGKGRSPLGLTHPPWGLTDDNESDLCLGHAGPAGNTSVFLFLAEQGAHFL